MVSAIVRPHAPGYSHKKCTSSSCCSPSKLWRTLQTLISTNNTQEMNRLCQDPERTSHVLNVVLTSRLANDPSQYPASHKHRVLQFDPAVRPEATRKFGKKTTDLNAVQLALVHRHEGMAVQLLQFVRHHASVHASTVFVNHLWGHRNTSLHLACFMNMPRTVKLLLDMGAHGFIKNQHQFTATDLCHQKSCLDMMKRGSVLTVPEIGAKGDSTCSQAQIPLKTPVLLTLTVLPFSLAACGSMASVLSPVQEESESESEDRRESEKRGVSTETIATVEDLLHLSWSDERLPVLLSPSSSLSTVVSDPWTDESTHSSADLLWQPPCVPCAPCAPELVQAWIHLTPELTLGGHKTAHPSHTVHIDPEALHVDVCSQRHTQESLLSMEIPPRKRAMEAPIPTTETDGKNPHETPWPLSSLYRHTSLLHPVYRTDFSSNKQKKEREKDMACSLADSPVSGSVSNPTNGMDHWSLTRPPSLLKEHSFSDTYTSSCVELPQTIERPIRVCSSAKFPF
ncbi:hypothetical protein BDF14DRAFT_1795227 [Spinellus fusiger]|nr:hypothetical protein BDF14DRAFT_1795227 [Spinellus fusiger]